MTPMEMENTTEKVTILNEWRMQIQRPSVSNAKTKIESVPGNGSPPQLSGLYSGVQVPYTPPEGSGPSNESQRIVDDKDVRRLEDRIDSVNRESQLRLDAAMAKIDGKLDVISNAIAELAFGNSEIKSDVKGIATETSARFRDLRTLIIGTGVVIIFGVLTIMIGLKQVWIGGVQVGQVSQEAAHTSNNSSSTPSSSPAK